MQLQLQRASKKGMPQASKMSGSGLHVCPSCILTVVDLLFCSCLGHASA